MISHTPFGSGHPYRHDLDQRVPPHPLAGERFEVRALADSDVTHLAIVFGDGTVIDMTPIDPADVEQEIGPFPAQRSVDGHLASAAESARLDANAKVWIGSCRIDSLTSYRIVGRAVDGSITETSSHRVDALHWTTHCSGTIDLVGPSDRFRADTVRWLVGADGPRRVRFGLRLDPDQHIIGLGERYATVDHRGEVLDAVVFEQYKHQGRRTYLPVPMAVVVGGDHWGFHVDTSRRTWFDLGASDTGMITIEAELDPAAPDLRVRLWSGPPQGTVRQFLAATGVPPTPPAWIFQPWISSNEWNTQARVEAEVARSLAEGIAVGVVVIEAWSDESTFVAWRDATYEVHPDASPHRLADFSFPAEGAWPDPVAMVARLHEQGVRVLLWQIPLIPTDRGDDGQVAADVRSIVDQERCVRDADGAPHRNRGWWFPGALLPDFTNPSVRAWWRDRRRYLIEEVGIDGFKTDGGEHPWGHDLRYHDGTRGDETNNRFPVLYAQTFHELFDTVGATAVTFSRAGFTGAAAFPCHWAGDDDSTWDGLQAAIRAGLSAGVAGIYFWTWDLAGFSGPIPDADLYKRATAMSAFCPIMQYHAEYNHHRVPSGDRTPWNIAERTGDPTVLAVSRRFAELRRRLVPYLVEQSIRSIASGKPLMRPLCFDHPDDPDIWRSPLQFQLGDSLVVAPVTEPGTSEVDVYLPPGDWIDCFTGAAVGAPGRHRRNVSHMEIAVFARAADFRSGVLDGVFAGLPNG